MKLSRAEFLLSAAKPDQFPPPDLPEVAFAGRSNVGKSSLINSLVGEKGLAKTSSTPGKTRQINFFRIEATASTTEPSGTERQRRVAMRFVDFPGFGYANVPKEVAESWTRLISAYLSRRDNLRLVVQLFDLRHPPTERDLELTGLLARHGFPTLLVGTKADKLTRNQQAQSCRNARKVFGLGDDHALLAYSAHTGQGRKELWDFILEAVMIESPIEGSHRG